MKYVVCLHLYIPWKFGERVSTPRGATGLSLSFCFLFVCPSRYDARHRKPRRCVYTLNLGGTGISPRTKVAPGKRPPGQKHPRTKIPPAPDTQQAATYSTLSQKKRPTLSFALTLTDIDGFSKFLQWYIFCGKFAITQLPNIPQHCTPRAVFTVRRSALHGLCDRNSVRPSVCLFVRLSHSWTVSTSFDLRSWFLHHMVAPSS